MEQFKFSDDQIQKLTDMLERYSFEFDKIKKFIIEVQSIISQSQFSESTEHVKETRNYLFDFEDQAKETHRMLLKLINEEILSQSTLDRLKGERSLKSHDSLIFMENHRENLEGLIADIEQLREFLNNEKLSGRPSHKAFCQNIGIAFKQYLGDPYNNRGALTETIEEMSHILNLPKLEVSHQIKHILESI